MDIPHTAGRIPAHLHSAGVDLVDLGRWERAMRRCGDALARRYFTPQERRTAHERADDGGCSPDEVLGHLFGVKESVVKAMGGLPPGARLADICVGMPGGDGDREPWTVHLSGPLVRWAEAEWVGVVDVVGASARLGDGMALAWAAARTPGAPS